MSKQLYGRSGQWNIDVATSLGARRGRARKVLVGCLLLGIGLVGAAVLAKVQVVTVSNGMGESVFVPEVNLACDKIVVGALRPSESKTFVIRRSCRGEAAYAVTLRRADGTTSQLEACYIEGLPRMSKLRLVESPLGARCEHSGLLDLALGVWRR